jgi:hypothetical protein
VTFAIDVSQVGLALAWPALIPLLVLIFPWPIVRHLVIPLGLPRVAYVLTHFAFVTWAGRTRSGAIVAAAWAALRSKRDVRDFLVALEEQLVTRRLGVAEATAFGLIAAKRGLLDDARLMLASAEELAKNHPPTIARAIAAEWVAADAAARGDWSRAARIGRLRDAFARTRATRLIGDVAARLIGEESIPIWRLWLRWAIAPNRLWTRALVERAASQAPGSASKVVRPDPVVLPAEEDPFMRAMTLHVALLKREKEAILDADLSRLAHAWDDALADRELLQRSAARASALGAPSSIRPLSQLAEDVQSDLVALARSADIPLSDGESGPTMTGAKKKLRDETISELELAAAALEQRVRDKRKHPAVDEWREWLALRRQAEIAFRLGGARLHRLGFSALHGPVCSLAVWLFNERSENHAAHAIFVWLLSQAEAVDDLDAIRLQQGNVAASAAWF